MIELQNLMNKDAVGQRTATHCTDISAVAEGGYRNGFGHGTSCHATLARLRVVYQSVRRGWKKKEEERRTVKLETQSPTSLAKIPQSLPFLSFACLLCSFLNIPYESSCNIPGNDSYRATYLAMTYTV